MANSVDDSTTFTINSNQLVPLLCAARGAVANQERFVVVVFPGTGAAVSHRDKRAQQVQGTNLA